MSAPLGPGVADQLDAAVAEVHHGLDALVVDKGYSPGTVRADPWLARLVERALGDGSRPPRLCPHVAAMHGPAPVFLTAADARVECAGCHGAALAAIAGTVEDITCDRCRRVAPDRRLSIAATHLGPLVIPLGLCRACVPAIAAEAATDAVGPR